MPNSRERDSGCGHVWNPEDLINAYTPYGTTLTGKATRGHSALGAHLFRASWSVMWPPSAYDTTDRAAQALRSLLLESMTHSPSTLRARTPR